MEAVQLLTLGLAIVVFLIIFQRTMRRSRATAKPTTLIEIRDSAAARAALIDHADAFSNHPLTLFPVALVIGRRRRRSDSINTAPHGPLWRALRGNLTSGTLHPSRSGHLAALQRDAAASLVASLFGDGSAAGVAVRDAVHAAVFRLVARLCFGDLVVDGGDASQMRRVMQEFVAAIGEASVLAGSWLAKLARWKQWRRFLAYRGQQAAFFLPLVSRRRRQRRCDAGCGGGIRPYVDSLIDLRVPDGGGGGDIVHAKSRRALSDDEMVSLLSEFLGAGTEPVVSCVEWALAHLATEPEVKDKLRREVVATGGGGGGEEARLLRGLPYLNAVVLETLRLHPPVPLLVRDVAGAAVGAAAPAGGGARVHFLIREMARDGRCWTDPDVFRPERFLAGGEAEGVGAVPGSKEIRMMPFGAGRRHCPGAAMGMMHIKCFLAALVREFEWAPAEDVCGVDFTELDGFFKVMKTPLKARVKRIA